MSDETDYRGSKNSYNSHRKWGLAGVATGSFMAVLGGVEIASGLTEGYDDSSVKIGWGVVCEASSAFSLYLGALNLKVASSIKEKLKRYKK